MGKAASPYRGHSAIQCIAVRRPAHPPLLRQRQMPHHLMDYRVFDLESRAPLDTLELHVLARAYYAAWRAVHGAEPERRHPMPMFNAFFDFDDSPASPSYAKKQTK